MSYGITIKSAGGELQVSSYGDVPDGEHDLTGHDNTNQVSGGQTIRSISISVARRDPEGRYVTSAQHVESRPA
jgi:hypothetical protein